MLRQRKETSEPNSTDGHQEEPSSTVHPRRENSTVPRVSERGWCSGCLSRLKYVLLALLVPPFLNYCSLQQEQQHLKPEGGQLYDVGWGQKMFLQCWGKGSPTVILDAPTGMTSDVWSLLWPQISPHTRVCVYDRAGLGFSERPYENVSISEERMKQDVNFRNRWQPFTTERMVEDLHQLVTVSSQQPQPLLLVGAEIGALVSQFYSQLYPSEVMGMVLINPLPDTLFQQDAGLWTNYWFGQLLPGYQSLQLGAALGLTRLALLLGVFQHPLSTAADLPDLVHKRQKHLLCHPRHLSSVVDEHHFINDSLSQLRTVRLLKSLPSNISVTLITGNYYDEQMPSPLNKAWAKAERQLISTSLPPQAKHILITDADHRMLYRKPATVLEPILKMVRLWRQHHKATAKKM